MTLDELNERISMLQIGEVLRLENVPEQIYHDSIGIGSTKLKAFIRSPATFKANPPQKHKAAFDLGSAVHCRVLEPDLYAEKFVTQPEEFKTKSSKAYKEWALTIGDATVLTVEQTTQCLNMAESVLSKYAGLFEGGCAEVSYWKRLSPSIVLKARHDYEIDGVAIDLKTTANLEPEKFQRDAINYAYHVQKSAYGNATGFESFVFVCVEKEAPYLCQHKYLSDDADQLGELLVMKAIDDLVQCHETNIWPDFPGDNETIELAPWDYKKLEELRGNFK